MESFDSRTRSVQAESLDDFGYDQECVDSQVDAGRPPRVPVGRRGVY